MTDHSVNTRTAALHNLGCKVNAYETEAMQQALEEAGYRIVPFEEKADVYVINTCSVTNMADRKSRQMLSRARSMNPGAVIVAAGCYVQTAKEKTGLEIPADLVIGTGRKGELVQMLDEYFAARGDQEDEKEAMPVMENLEDVSTRRLYEHDLQISRSQEHTRAFMKVQDGCNMFCSYCIIPYARGRIRSREQEDVLAEMKRLAQNGIREVVLTGIHLSSYGLDRGSKKDGSALVDLIEAAAGVEGIDRIRLGSLEPRLITPENAARMASIEKLCPHFHLSLQSGCDSVLKRMNRHYTAQEYAQRVQILREYFDQPALTTDVIVGFPGETEEEFEQTEAFLKQIRLYETHLFKYSRREGTKAAAMPGQITDKEKTRRSARLAELGRENKAAFERSWIGKEVSVLLEEAVKVDGRQMFTGYTKEYIRVLVPADQDYTNRIVRGTLKAGVTADSMGIDLSTVLY